MAKKIFWGIFIIVLVILFLLIWQRQVKNCPPVLLTDSAGSPATEFQLNDSIIFRANRLEPRSGYEIQVIDNAGNIIQHLALSTDQKGVIPETVLWYNVGMRLYNREADSAPFTNISVDNTDYSVLGRTFTINIIKAGRIVRRSNFSIAQLFTQPMLYAANSKGCLKSGFLIGEEDVWAMGKNFPQGSIIRLWAVPANSDYQENSQLLDQTKQYGYAMPPLFELKSDESEFRKLLWPRHLTSLGSYDIVAEVIQYDSGKYRNAATAAVKNIVAHKTYSGFVIQRRPGAAEPLEVDIAGNVSSPFTFRNTFLTSENVYVGVDPCLQPSYVGQTAKVFIAQDKTDAEWTIAANNHTDLNTLDVTGFTETITVGGICGNCWKTLAWTAPLVLGKYDVVLDFNMDNQYTPGVDLIDSLDATGFIVSDIRVDTISFNYRGAGAITIYNNQDGSNITSPEYISANHIVKPAAWVKGGAHTVEVEFKAAPAVSSADVWAEGISLTLNTSASPVSVSFSGGTGTAVFNVNNTPTSIGKHQFAWDWKYQNVNGNPTPVVDMGETGEHLLYTTYSTPNAPMTTPWLEVLDTACTWANGQSAVEAARAAVVADLNDIGDLDGDIDYVVWGSYTGGIFFTALNFNLTQFLSDLKTMSNMDLYCADCAGALQTYSNALGLNMGYVKIDLSGTTNYFDPIGNGNVANSTDPEENWQTIGWGWHCIGWRTGNIVYDACLHLDGNGSPASAPFTRLIAANMTFTEYGDHLMPSPAQYSYADINVVTVY